MTQEDQKNKSLGLKALSTLTTRTGVLTLYEGNILCFYFYDDMLLTVEDVIELSEANVALTGTDMYFSIVVPGYRNDLTKEAREFDFYEALNRQPTCIAEAVVINDLPTRIVADFYYKLRKFPYPVRVLAGEEEALEWFRQIGS